MNLLREYIRGLLVEYGRAHTPGKKNVYRGMKIEMPAGLAAMVRMYMKTGQARGMSRGELMRFILAQCQDEHCGESWSISFDIAVKFSKSWQAKNNRGKTLYIVLQATVDEDAGYDPQAAGEEPGMFYDEQEVRFQPGAEIPLTGIYVFQKSKDEWEKHRNQFHIFMAKAEDDPVMVKA
jgi:hypothetical protein